MCDINGVHNLREPRGLKRLYDIMLSGISESRLFESVVLVHQRAHIERNAWVILSANGNPVQLRDPPKLARNYVLISN